MSTITIGGNEINYNLGRFYTPEVDGVRTAVYHETATSVVYDVATGKNLPTLLTEAATSANAYTDQKVAAIVGGAPETLDTLEELAAAIKNNPEVVDALNEAIATKLATATFTATLGTLPTVDVAEGGTRSATIVEAIEFAKTAAITSATTTAATDATTKANAVKTAIEAELGTLPEGYTTFAEYIAAVNAGIATTIAAKVGDIGDSTVKAYVDNKIGGTAGIVFGSNAPAEDTTLRAQDVYIQLL